MGVGVRRPRRRRRRSARRRRPAMFSPSLAASVDALLLERTRPLRGRPRATASSTVFANAWNSSLFETGSVSQPTRDHRAGTRRRCGSRPCPRSSRGRRAWRPAPCPSRAGASARRRGRRPSPAAPACSPSSARRWRREAPSRVLRRSSCSRGLLLGLLPRSAPRAPRRARPPRRSPRPARAPRRPAPPRQARRAGFLGHRFLGRSVLRCRRLLGCGSAGAAAPLPFPFAVISFSVTLLWPAAIPSAIARTIRPHERIASSLPGMM